MTREEAMPDLKPNPCQRCQLRQYYAREYDMHFYGEDCPYRCDAYEEWNRRAGEEDKHEAD